MPIGMLMKRIQRQVSSSVSRAPRRAPAAPPAPATVLQIPMARALAFGSRNVVVRIVSDVGERIAAPMLRRNLSIWGQWMDKRMDKRMVNDRGPEYPLRPRQ
jgi:hypothetical protein